MLKECKDINFIGSIEARDIPAGKADVVVCEAFVGKCNPEIIRGCRRNPDQKSKGRHDDKPAFKDWRTFGKTCTEADLKGI